MSDRSGLVYPGESASAGLTSGTRSHSGNGVFDPSVVLAAAPPVQVMSDIVRSSGVDGVVRFLDEWGKHVDRYTVFVAKSASASHAFARVGGGASGLGGVPSPAASLSGLSRASGGSRGSRVQSLAAPPWKTAASWRPKARVPDGLCYMKAFTGDHAEAAGLRLGEWPKFFELLSQSWAEFESLDVLRRFRVVEVSPGKCHLATSGSVGQTLMSAAAEMERVAGPLPRGSVGAVLAAAEQNVDVKCEGFCLDSCDCGRREKNLLSDVRAVRIGGGHGRARIRSVGDGFLPNYSRAMPVGYLGGLDAGDASLSWKARVRKECEGLDCVLLSAGWDKECVESHEVEDGEAGEREARDWSARAREGADVVMYGFSSASAGLDELLELGSVMEDAKPENVVVYCPDGWRMASSVDAFCARVGVVRFGDRAEAVGEFFRLLSAVAQRLTDGPGAGFARRLPRELFRGFTAGLSDALGLVSKTAAMHTARDRKRLRVLEACGDAAMTYRLALRAAAVGASAAEYQQARSAASSNASLAECFQGLGLGEAVQRPADVSVVSHVGAKTFEALVGAFIVGGVDLESLDVLLESSGFFSRVEY